MASAATTLHPRHMLLRLVFAITCLRQACSPSPSFALQFSAPSGGNGFSNQPGSPVDAPQTNLTPIAAPPTAYQPPAGYGSFDPYATTNPGAATTPIPGVTNGLGSRSHDDWGRRAPPRWAALRSLLPAVCSVNFSHNPHPNPCPATAPPHPPRFMAPPPPERMEFTAQRDIPPRPTQPPPRVHCSPKALAIFNTTR